MKILKVEKDNAQVELNHMDLDNLKQWMIELENDGEGCLRDSWKSKTLEEKIKSIFG